MFQLLCATGTLIFQKCHSFSALPLLSDFVSAGVCAPNLYPNLFCQQVICKKKKSKILNVCLNDFLGTLWRIEIPHLCKRESITKSYLKQV